MEVIFSVYVCTAHLMNVRICSCTVQCVGEFQCALTCRNGFLQLDESMVAMNQDMSQGGIILASDGDYLTQKDGTIPQFAALNIVDGQVG